MKMNIDIVKTAVLTVSAATFSLGLLPATSYAAQTSPATWHGCPASKLCFYKDADYRGGPLELNECGVDYLSSYSYARTISSWVNNTGHEAVSVHAWNGKKYGMGRQLWAEQPGTSSRYVGHNANDLANGLSMGCK